MAKHGFDLGDYLRAAEGVGPYGSGVSEQDTREQIEYIDLDRIDPDPENFYLLEGLKELAANIELVGLQQPLRVRATSAENDGPPRASAPTDKTRRYTVVSGHRRRVACLMIRDGGNDMFRDGVPCIVERGDVSREMRELRLIYANAATRVMTSAELSKQAARVEELLYALKKQGVEFPGRMRDHVAAAVNASKTKLARLHAIRGKLVPPLLKMFDAGEINESVAYRISQEAAEIQEDLAKAPALLRGETAEKIGQIIDKLKASAPPVGADGPGQLLSALCADSPSAPGGPKPTLNAQRAEENAKYFEMLSEVADRFLPCIGGVPSRQEGIEALKQKHGSCHHAGTGENCFYQSSAKGLALEPDEDAGVEIVRTWTEVYDLLCTIAVARLLAKDDGRSRTPAPTEIIPTWQKGTPPKTAYYAARLEFYGKPIASPRVLWWDEGVWYNAVGDDIRQHRIDSQIRVVGWWPLPERE